uniref:eCIS core domain-containing protein n=1 Tax=Sphingopyxis sp. KK2 TaxID=1855727 RepID=UPI00097E65A6
ARTSAAPKAAPPVMRAPAPLGRTALPPLASLAAIPAGPVVQRECAACEAEDKEPGLQRRLNAAASAASVQRQCAACESEDKEQSSVQPRLEVGPVGDRYEQEADSIAAQVMAMPAPDAMPSDVSAAAGAVQRACGACSSSSEEPRARRFAEPEEEKEGKVRARRDEGGETIAASDTQLTSGGSALPAATRSFFESRMGRDLGDVRVHSGDDASAKNASISARAFTYKNHVWLGAGESASPSFTMAHELAHVMQQTAPGPVGPGVARRPASAARAAVRRASVPFWLPAEFTLPGAAEPMSALMTNTGKHHAAVTALAKANSSSNILTEVMMPNAKADGAGCGLCGFADLYRSDQSTVPGVELDCGKTEPPTAPKSAPGLKVFDATTTSSCGFAAGGTAAAGASTGSGRAPTLAAGAPVGSISGIQLADMKPGHNESARAKGVDQLNSYFDGMTLVRDKARAAGGASIYQFGNPKLMPQTLMPNIPAKWDPNQKGGDWPVNNIRLHMGPLNDFSPPGIKGRWSIAKDPINSGIWTYFLAPEPTSLAAAMKTPEAKKHGVKSAKAKIDKIIGCLTAPPSSRKAACKRPLPKARRRPLAGSTAPARVQRKTPVPKTDHFNLENWNNLRRGTAGAGKGVSLKTQLDKDFKKDVREKIRFQGRAVESIDWMKKSLGVQRDKPRDSDAMTAGRDLLEKMMFWAGETPVGDVARFFGMLRKSLGGVFIKAAQAYEKVKAKFHATFKGAPFKTSNSAPAAQAAMRVAKAVFMTIGKIVIAKTTSAIVKCIESGFVNFIKSKVEGGLDDLLAQAAEAEKFITQIKDDIFASVETEFAAIVKPFKDDLDSIIGGAKMIASITGAVVEAIKVVRLGFCLAGLGAAGVGAIVTCILSLADYIASKFGYSPLDWLVQRMMKSCPARQVMAKAILAVEDVSKLPTVLAQKILRKLKDLVPAAIQPMFCDIDKMVVEDVELKDYQCKMGSGDESDGDGEGGGSGDGGGPAEQEGDAADGGGSKGGEQGGGAPAKDDGQSGSTGTPGIAGSGGEAESKGGAPAPAGTSSVKGGTVTTGDPKVGSGFIESGIDPNRAYNNENVPVRITINLGDHIIRDQPCTIRVVNLGPAEGGGKLAYFYFPDDAELKKKEGTFVVTEPGKEPYNWSPNRGPKHKAAFPIRGSGK